MNRIDVFWELVNRADWPGQNFGLVTWRDGEEWEPGTREWLLGTGLIREVAATNFASCSDCLDVHIEEVSYRRLPGGELLAFVPCPVNGTARLHPDSLRRWQIDLPAFIARLTCERLTANPGREVIPKRCWLLGTGQGTSIFLLRGVLWPDAPQTFLERHSFPPGSRLVHLAPLSPAFRPETGEWFSLSQVLDPEQMRLSFDAVDSSSQPAFEMRKRGNFWTLTFGKQSAIVRHRVGLAYLRIILAEPSRAFSALDLASAASHGSTSVQSVGEQEGLVVYNGYSSEDMIDEGYRRQLQHRILQLSSKKNMRGLSAAEDEELNDLRQRLRAATDIRGHTRKVSREAERARVSVTNAISRAMAEISKELPDLAEHLRTHIKTGAFFSYEGDGVVSWSFS